MNSIGAVAVLHPQDSLNNQLSTPNKFTHSQNSNFTGDRRTKGIRKNNRFTELAASNTSEFFAGSVLVESPPPSSVPIPGFFTKSLVSAGRDDPTTELRRILGLSLS